jgi:hypothetical protein
MRDRLTRDLTTAERQAVQEVAGHLCEELVSGGPLPIGVVLGYAVQLAVTVDPETTLDDVLVMAKARRP